MLFRRRTQDFEAGGVAAAGPPERFDAEDRSRDPGDTRVVKDGRRPRPRGGSRAAAVGAGATRAVSGGVLMIARLVRLIAIGVALIIGLAILLRVLGAHSSNTIVSGIHDAGKALVGPFDGMFKVSGAKATMSVNWGIALVVYLVAGSMLAGIIARMAIVPRRRARRLRARAA